MTAALSPREAILRYLLQADARTSQIAASLGMPERSARRRLRFLIGEGYVFSPQRGSHRITAFGRLAIGAPGDSLGGQRPSTPAASQTPQGQAPAAAPAVSPGRPASADLSRPLSRRLRRPR